MSNEIQEKMLEAIDVLINSKLNQLDSNTTIIATITGVLDSSGTQYSCEGNGNNFNAVSTTDTPYAIGDSVYVLMSNEKNIILGNFTSENNINTSLATKNNYYSVGGNFLPLNNYTETIGISSYKKTDGKIIYEKDNENNLINFSELDLAKFSRYITEADALLLQATFQTNLPIYQTRNTTGVYGLKIVLNFEQEDIEWTKTLYLNSTAMSGNPYKYTSPNQQYAIFALKDGEGRAFKDIQSIEFIGGNFVAINDATKSENNIFCSNIKLICLEPIDKTEDYYLLIDAPDGACFNSTGTIADDSLTITAHAYYNKTDISAVCSYSWFIQDGRIDVNNAEYRSNAGVGWRYLSSEDISKTFFAFDNQAEQTNYLCIATYNNQIIIRQRFSLFNVADDLSKIKIYSSEGKINFSFNNNTPTLICSINNETEFDFSYNFIWYKIENNVYNLIMDELVAKTNYEILKNTFSDDNITALDLANASDMVEASQGVVINNNKLIYPVKNINANEVSFVCQVYHNDIFIGQGQIKLTNTINDFNKNVIINNGNQVFQYTEAGISPCSESLEMPQEILPLTAQAFNTIDDPVLDSEIQSVTWKFPLTASSMIIPPIEAELSNQDNENYYINTTIDQPVYFSIKPNYDISAINNQITVILQARSGVTYTGTTNFIFTKIGNFENNGTNFIAKITPINNVKNLILFLNKAILSESINYYTNKELISINIKYDGINNTKLNPETDDDPDFMSIIGALESLETTIDRTSKCGYWADYVKNYLSENKVEDENALKIYKTLYLDLRQVFRGLKTVDEILFDYLDNYQSLLSFNSWNVQEPPQLKVKLYKTGIEITPNKVKWSILGSANRSKYLQIRADTNDFTQCEINVKDDLNDKQLGATNNLIIQAQIMYTDEQNKENICYATYPINVIIFNNYNAEDNTIPQPSDFEIIEDQTLRSVMYNSDGRNPVYNSKQGATIAVSKNFTYSYWFAEGGSGDSVATAPMIAEKDETDSLSCQVIPNDIYNGEFGNTNIHIILYEPKSDRDFTNLTSIFKEYGQPKVDIYIPIHFYLNRYGLASLNSWDGNHLEINEEENYILAPQIGAGKKEGDNSFTGLVMGEAKFYDDVDQATGELQPSSSIGLLGYNHGKQSVFINAEDGSAIFGLPEQRASAENNYTEGRIVIQPGGESKIGMWTIGSRSLYNINQGLQFVDENGNLITEENRTSPYITPIGYDPDLLKGKYYASDESGKDYNDFQNNGDMQSYGYAPYYRLFKTSSGDTEWKNSQQQAYDIPNASIVIPPEAQGLVLSANPAFISAKTMPLRYTDNPSKVNTIIEDEEDGKRYLLTDINLEAPNTILNPGDSLEVQINPNSVSPFGIFRHTKYPDDNGPREGNTDYSGMYYRYPLMGINHNGQLFVNSLQNGETDLRIGQIEAFGLQSGTTAGTSPYLGHKFIYNDEDGTEHVISKMFINKAGDIKTNGKLSSLSPLYITAGQDEDNEYSRSISIHGKTISLYATQNNDKDVLTSHRLTIADDNVELGHLEAFSYVVPNRTLTKTGTQESGWDKYQDQGKGFENFYYWGRIFENNLTTTYYSNGNLITPGKNYYINENNPSDIYADNNNFKKITKSENTTFSKFSGLTITKACIPVHWNKNGIIDSVYASDGTTNYMIHSNNTSLDTYDCYYFNSNSNRIVKSEIKPSALIGQHFSSVLNTIVKILVLPGTPSNYTITQMDLNFTEFNFGLTNNNGGGEAGTGILVPVYPTVLNPATNKESYTLNPNNLNASIDWGNSPTFEPPRGYSVYTGNNIPIMQNYVGSNQLIFIANNNAQGAFLQDDDNVYNLYWLQPINTIYLKETPNITKKYNANIPITNFTRQDGVFISATDVSSNNWIDHAGLIEPVEEQDSKISYNYFNIGNDNNSNITESNLNLPSNNFSLNIQNDLFNLSALKDNSFVTINTSKGMAINTSGQTEINLNSSSGDIKLLNYNNSGQKLTEITAGKGSSSKGFFNIGAWSGSTQIARINSDNNEKLYLYSRSDTIHKTEQAYYLQTLGSEGVDITASNSFYGYGAHNTKTAYLKLAPGSGSGTFKLQGGNNYVAGDSSGINIAGYPQTNIKGNTSWISLHYNSGVQDHITGAKGVNILQSNADIYLNGAKQDQTDWRQIHAGALKIYRKTPNKNSFESTASITKDGAISGSSVSVTGTITASGEVTGKGIKLSTHNHPFSMTGTINFHKNGYYEPVDVQVPVVSHSTFTYYDPPWLSNKIITAIVRRKDNHAQEGSKAQLTLAANGYGEATAPVNEVFEIWLGVYNSSTDGDSYYGTPRTIEIYEGSSGSTTTTVKKWISAIDKNINIKINGVTQLSGHSQSVGEVTEANGRLQLNISSASMGSARNPS